MAQTKTDSVQFPVFAAFIECSMFVLRLVDLHCISLCTIHSIYWPQIYDNN